MIKSNEKIGIISWVNGEKVKEVNSKLCKELIEFFKSTSFRLSPYAKKLSSASDFHSTLNGYLFLIKDFINF